MIQFIKSSRITLSALLVFSMVAFAVVAPAPEADAIAIQYNYCKRVYVLKQGSRNVCVKEAQKRLNSFKYCMVGKRPLAVDGVFGPATRALTLEFQRFKNIKADGIIGKVTWDRLGSPCRG